ncbi:DUF4290 domain-containing protein [Porphyromonas crevioricanis]|uniref:DUF4290 domain-containing protein n=2 Tax=Porphyromonas crevioricanis TaxID=393921 RepID=A0A2X4PH76_9PORP|nr:DUF4290 domain-containing protein [Porphyromonas crevioricanis]GAD06292.1 hypothetical protein PORCRE_2023 [Porphyromonas crevioricanis JCM 15906]GAD06733.1 hypothetical protein PORCAN_334 [Porphyromonas crevioricanis JCM 13913]SJZ54923.1 protein of unknown function [Porphyromonas crevioricanis]SQH73304.1 Uncharacterised protein [Porphyromonas crevioricanis]
MMKYSKQPALALPEYGRNIQNMVNHCLSIPDRVERNFCARSIVRIMSGMFPEFKVNNGNNENVYWDHLAIMADFKLDIDYPCEVIRKDQLEKQPTKVPYPDNDIIYRHYGHIVQELIKKASEMKPGEEREALSLMIANQMKRSYANWNKPEVTDFRIFKDLYEFSDGEIELSEDRHILSKPEIHQQDNTTKQGNKKKKKK